MAQSIILDSVHSPLSISLCKNTKSAPSEEISFNLNYAELIARLSLRKSHRFNLDLFEGRIKLKSPKVKMQILPNILKAIKLDTIKTFITRELKKLNESYKVEISFVLDEKGCMCWKLFINQRYLFGHLLLQLILCSFFFPTFPFLQL